MAAATGAIAASSIVYGYPLVLLAFIGIILLVWRLVHNLVLGNAAGLLTLPLVVWLATNFTMATLAAAGLVAVIVVKYIPDALADYRKRGLASLGPDEINPKRE
jgi:glycerol-3-phosphate acyltransferase PlsY